MPDIENMQCRIENLEKEINPIQGNRATIGSKMQTQALPLVDRQVPWVQAGSRTLYSGKALSFENDLGKLVVPCAPVSGKVVKVDSQYIYIDPTGKKVAEETKPRYKTPDNDVYYHGSPHKFDTLRSGAWVTPHKEDAHAFGVPWDSNDLIDKGDDADGRPPLSLKFKPGREPNDRPLYVYEVSGPTKPADTNTGKHYSWNRQTTKDLPVKLVAFFPSWRDWQDHLLY